MAFVFDPSVGTLTANSYISVEEANDYFAARLGTDYWDALNKAKKQSVLVMSTRRIDRERFGGIKTHYTEQSLQWPRTNIIDRNSHADSDIAPTFEPGSFYFIDPNTIPPELKYATCEQALYYIKQSDDDTTTVSDYDLETLTSYKLGPIGVTIKDNVKADRLPTVVKDLLKSIGPNAWAGERGIRYHA